MMLLLWLIRLWRQRQARQIARGWGKPEFAPGPRCTLPPPGWVCTAGEGHQGPCPCWPEYLT